MGRNEMAQELSYTLPAVVWQTDKCQIGQSISAGFAHRLENYCTPQLG